MIDLYYWNTPNGYKISIALEEMGLAYRTHFIDIHKGDQFEQGFEKISANRRIPAIKDGEFTLFESGAILQYLAEKSGKFGGENKFHSYQINQWLFWQVGGVGPMFGQAWHFKNNPEGNAYSINRYNNEVRRLLGVLETALNGREYVAGSYSIADMAIFPWVHTVSHLDKGILADFSRVGAYIERNESRPATKRGLNLTPPKS